MSGQTTIEEFRIGEGGLLRRFESLAHLTRLRRQIAAVLLVTWVPLVVLGVISEQLNGKVEPLLRDPSLHVRLLVAAPVFLFLDQVFPRVCRTSLEKLAAQNLVPATAKARFDRLLRSTRRIADSPLPELLLALLVVSAGIGILVGVLPVRGFPRGGHLTPVQVWYALTDLPLLQFLFLRSLWRWAIWVRFLAGLARIPLDLVVSHPDLCGGISFIRLPSREYCALLLFAISSVLCAGLHGRFVEAASLVSFGPVLLLFGAMGTLIAFGPLILFTPQLYRAHRHGIVEYGELVTNLGRRFRRDYLASHLREVPEIQPLAEANRLYRDTVDPLRMFLFGKRDMVVLLIATLLPMVPLIVASVPLEDWRELIGLFTGGKLFFKN